MSMTIHQGNVYRRKAGVEVSYDALDPESQSMVDLWLSNSGKTPGTPEYEKFKKKMIQRILDMMKPSDLTKRVNYASTKR